MTEQRQQTYERRRKVKPPKHTYDFDEEVNKTVSFISSYITQKGYPPSIRNISDALDLRSSATAYKVLNKCVIAGLIEVDPKIPRAIRVTTQGKKLSNKRPRLDLNQRPAD